MSDSPTQTANPFYITKTGSVYAYVGTAGSSVYSFTDTVAQNIYALVSNTILDLSNGSVKTSPGSIGIMAGNSIAQLVRLTQQTSTTGISFFDSTSSQFSAAFASLNYTAGQTAVMLSNQKLTGTFKFLEILTVASRSYVAINTTEAVTIT